MDIVFLSSEAMHHYYLINQIHQSFPVRKVFFQTVHEEDRSFTKRFGRLMDVRRIRFTARGIIAGILYGKERKLEDAYERQMFFGNKDPFIDPTIPSEKVHSFNDKDVAKKIRGENPDIIIVFGTEILKGDILKVAKTDILNIHRDILPKYRGGAIKLWVFYNKDFENLGTTIHVCREKLDAGEIVGQGFYTLKRDDEIYKLRYKTTMLAVDLLRDVLSKYSNGNVSYVTQERTKLWTSEKMTIVKQIKARYNFKKYIRHL